VSQALNRIRRVARQRKKEKFTALFHHLSVEHLEAAFFELKEDAAPGVDGLTWRAYEADLSRNLAFIATLMDSGVEFVAVDNPYANKLTIHILAAVAQHEREISHNGQRTHCKPQRLAASCLAIPSSTLSVIAPSPA
jgi:hypothetical protein